MSIISGWGASLRGLFADNKGPWGSSGPGDAGNEPVRGPWGEPSAGGKLPSGQPSANRASLDEFLRKSRARWSGGGGGGLPRRPERSTIVWGVVGALTLWLVFTSMHSIAPEQRGVVSRFGRYVYTLGPGIGLTLPSPIERVDKIDVEDIRTVDLGSTRTDDLMLTGDQNIIDIAYSVRWNIRDPELFLFELARPEETIRQVAESSMRAVVSSVSLDDAIGDKRSEIEARVAENMQRILNAYSSGVLIQGVAIKQADPPQAVNDAFKDVSAAQQDAQRYVNAANAYAQQLTAKAQGEATAFDKVYEQYRLAPEVTRRRMYYETMERVLAKVDKTIIEAPGVMPYLPLPQAGRAAPKATEGAGQ
ncbi:MAG: FtsH protease activity modulator HflK [Sphingomicrobium sp.]